MLVWIAAGLAAGFLSGLMGVGGGIVMTPVLHYGLGYDWTTSIAVSLWAITLQALLGLWRHHGKGAVDWRLGGLMAVGGAPGVAVGMWLEPRIPVPDLKLLFAAAMLVTAVQLVRRTTTQAGRASVPLALGTGLLAGIVSRLLGIGGGLVTVPALALAGVPVHLAIGSSLVPVWTNAAIASLGNIGRDIPWLGGTLMAAFALAGSLAGVEAAHRLPERAMRSVFAVGLVVLAVAVALTRHA